MDQKNIIIVILLAVLVVVSYLAFKEKLSGVNIVDMTLKCNQLYEAKKEKYWGDEIGQSKSIFNQKLNTCLALNIRNNSTTGEYLAMVIDMKNDKTMLYYSDQKGGNYVENSNLKECKNSYVFLQYDNIKEYGCEKYELLEKMFAQVKNYGFTVFDGISSN